MGHITVSLIEMGIAFLMAGGTVWASDKLLQRLLGTNDEGKRLTLNDQSTATAIVFASILIGATMIAIQAAQVIGTTLNAVSGDLVSALTHSLGFAAVAIVCALLAVTFSAKLTMGLTEVDEAEEISKNNVGVAVTLAVTIVAVSMFVAPAVRGLLVNLIPYQTTVVGDFIQE